MKFTEAQLESAIIDLLKEEGYPYLSGEAISRTPQDMLIKEDLRSYLSSRYEADGITEREIQSILTQLEAYSSSDLYETNKSIMKMVSDGFLLKREDHTQKDLYVQLIDYSALAPFRRRGQPVNSCISRYTIPVIQHCLGAFGVLEFFE